MCEFSDLDTLDKNGEAHHFVYGQPEEDQVFGDNYDQVETTSTYRIKTAPTDMNFYEFTVQTEGQDRLRVVMLENHLREEYKSKGIAQAMILMLARTSGKTVTSSSNRAGSGQYRNEPACKIWQSLVEKGLAKYYPEEDRFYAILQPQ